MALKYIGAATALVVGVSIAAGGALAHDVAHMPNTPAGKAVMVRHNNFKQQGAAFKAINDELKKDNPDNALLATNAAKLKGLVNNLPSWFPKGSGPESHLKTDAKPEIWSDAAGFQAAASRLQVEVSKLNQLAVAGDWTAFKGQTRAVGGACKGCHDKYRVPEKKT